MSESNKIPSNNSFVDLKIKHNELIDNQNHHGFVNFIANGNFQFTIDTTGDVIEDQINQEL